jgi:hypothetical protein
VISCAAVRWKNLWSTPGFMSWPDLTACSPGDVVDWRFSDHPSSHINPMNINSALRPPIPDPISTAATMSPCWRDAPISPKPPHAHLRAVD